MLAKKYKLPLGAELPKKPKTLRYPHYVVKIGSNTLSYSRYGVVISTKVNPHATIRNRIKRTVFELIRANNLHMIPQKDVVIIVSPSVDNLGKEALKTMLLRDLINIV